MTIFRSTGQIKRWVIPIFSVMLFAAGLSQPALSQNTGKMSASARMDACITSSGGKTAYVRACLKSEVTRFSTNLSKTDKIIVRPLTTKQLKAAANLPVSP